jgi:hypothetical protein
MPDDMIGRDVGHQFVALVKALSSAEPERECAPRGAPSACLSRRPATGATNLNTRRRGFLRTDLMMR